MTTPRQVRCPDCGKRFFDLEAFSGDELSLLIVCRCKQKFRVQLPNPNSEFPLLVRA